MDYLAFLALVILTASLESGAQATKYWLISSAINSIIICIMSFWRGVWKRDNLEIWCLVLGIAGVIIWIITRNASIAVYILTVVDIIAITPTVRKVWKNPTSEPKIAWSIGIIAAVLNILAIDSAKAAIVIAPVAVFLWHCLVLLPIYFKKQLEKIL